MQAGGAVATMSDMNAATNRPAGRLDIASALLPYRGTWDERRAAHLLRRAGFGGTPAETARYVSLGVNGAVDTLVHFPDTRSLPEPDDVYDPVAALQSAGGFRAIARDDV